MAISAYKKRINVTFTDTGNNDTIRTFDLGDNEFPTALEMPAFLAKLLAVTTAKIKGYTLVDEYVEDAFTVPANAQVEANARLTMTLENRPKDTATFDIPSPNPAIMVATEGDGLNAVNLSHAAVQDIVALFQPSGDFFISDGEKVAAGTAALRKGRRITKRSDRG